MRRPYQLIRGTTLRGALALLAQLGCGGPQRSEDPSATFAAIQVQEARIEAADARRTGCLEGRSPDPCEALCSAARSLCELAEPLSDHDAIARCERGRARCSACQEDPCPSLR